MVSQLANWCVCIRLRGHALTIRWSVQGDGTTYNPFLLSAARLAKQPLPEPKQTRYTYFFNLLTTLLCTTTVRILRGRLIDNLECPYVLNPSDISS